MRMMAIGGKPFIGLLLQQLTHLLLTEKELYEAHL